MTTIANLLVILIFLSGLYTLLGLICAVAEKVEATLAARRHQRRRLRREPHRRIPRRPPGRQARTHTTLAAARGATD
jgi:hypothetical protein